jgi:hypothetical protein
MPCINQAKLEEFLEAALLLVAVAPAIRLFLKKPIRHELGARPAFAALSLGVAVVVVVLLAWLWIRSDALRRLVVAGVAALALLALLRARPGYGRSRGLPPGSLGFAASLDAITDEDFYARCAARWGPVFKMSQFHRPVICVVDLPRGLELLQTQGDALVQTHWGLNPLVPGGYVEFMNGELHARMRRILSVGFSDAVLADCRQSIVGVVREQLSEMAGHNGGRSVDPEPFLDRIAFASVLRVVLGVPAASPRADEFVRHFAHLDSPLDTALPTPGRVREAFNELALNVNGLADVARITPSDTLERSVLAEVVDADEAHADDPTVIGNLVLLVSNGREILRGLLRWLLKMSAEDRRWALEMRALSTGAPGAAASVDGFATMFVRETLRTHGSPYIYRVVARTCWLGPYRLPKGWLLRLCVRESHLRPEVFPDPKTFDPRRFADRSYDRTEFCPFGHGAHACLGDELVVEVAKAFVRELALGYDVRIDVDGPSEHRNRHWHFWRPSRQLRIALSAHAGRASTGGLASPALS